MGRSLRIGTWNLNVGWNARKREFLEAQGCDVWLLTEVPDKALPDLPAAVVSQHRMARRQWYAALASWLPVQPVVAPHGASAAGCIEGVRVVASVLPWRGSAAGAPWVGSGLRERFVNTIDAIAAGIDETTVWGGDWNQTMAGANNGGTVAGRTAIEGLLARTRLELPTRALPHRLTGLHAIDHIALPATWTVRNAARVKADGMSDHDAYLVDFACS